MSKIIRDAIYQDLHNKYNKSAITKLELCDELGITLSTLNRHLASGVGTPNFFRAGGGAKAKVLFSIREVSIFLADTVKVL